MSERGTWRAADRAARALALAVVLQGAASASPWSHGPDPVGQRPPNVIVILSDDAGYADFSFQGSGEAATPHIDSIAAGGVRCTNGYVSASVCSPSRAGLLTGRYQQRFGHDRNIPPAYSETNGLPVEEVTLADALRAVGYRTIALGKWHLGYAPHFHPLSRGFDDYYGFLQGARSYRAIEGTRLNRLLRDREPVAEEFDYMTDELGAQAAAYITEHAERPFFLYLSFNAVHTPMHATEADLEAVAEGAKPKRRKLLAMTRSLDRAVGAVLERLRELDLERNTVLFFLNDNGGATNNASDNGSLRGRKGSPFEGGIRIPFLVRWPERLPAGAIYDLPVSTLDVFATALAAAGAEEAPANLDGVDLVPFLAGRRAGRPHDVLLWRRGDNLAIRSGDWKLVRKGNGPTLLFDLGIDPGETTDLAADHPQRVAALGAHWGAWSEQLSQPRW
ncbi:MAG: sulfatase-like hydrolase/transferase [Planctomycetota bacterium]|jgi:arylsulfatase A-like enzyme|nr:sulfatase-like hydrolase/transferase [Planctomycetota bacterium]MDP6763221.1 sulfatase-like hydrolase/transferase [Planctomycetota bacterium]MDP6990570.1 sulfatase-like hydrolase/transferase [Planctomycetota bacterium]